MGSPAADESKHMYEEDIKEVAHELFIDDCEEWITERKTAILVKFATQKTLAIPFGDSIGFRYETKLSIMNEFSVDRVDEYFSDMTSDNPETRDEGYSRMTNLFDEALERWLDDQVSYFVPHRKESEVKAITKRRANIKPAARAAVQ